MPEQIVDGYLYTFGDGPQAAKERIKLAAVVAEVDRLVPAEPAADQSFDRDGQWQASWQAEGEASTEAAAKLLAVQRMQLVAVRLRKGHHQDGQQLLPHREVRHRPRGRLHSVEKCNRCPEV